MIDNLKDLKDIYEFVKTSIDRCKEPKQELITLDTFLKALIAEPTILQEKVDKDYKRYFYDDFTHGLLKRLIREKSNDQKYLEVIADIFDDYLTIFLVSLKQGIYNQSFIESMKAIFEYDNLLHNYNYQISEEQIKRIRLQGQTWRAEIKEGDLLDAIQDDMSRCTGWSQAKVLMTAGDTLKLGFISEDANQKYTDKYSLDLAPFESKTKSNFEWKSTLKVGDLVDAYDKNLWNKSTILEIQDKMLANETVIKVALIGFRIYTEKGSRSDARGNFEGYQDKYDEWLSLYSPRIQPFCTKVTRNSYYDDLNDIDDDFDNQFPCEEGQSRVYAVPRFRKCTSKLFIQLMNKLGHLGGFDQIMAVIDKLCDNCTSQEELHAICTLIEMVAKPYVIYHKDFQKEYFPKIIELAKKCIRNAPDRFLRDINKDKVEAIIRSIDNMQKRNLTKEEREKETEVLKLEMALSCLKSGYLERRIQGIRDLNQLIKNNRVMSSKTIPNSFLVAWLQNNEVFPLLFDPKKTHLQIVQRLNDIIKLLLQEDQFTQQLLEMFWNLSKSDYKLEVYKILNDAAFYLKKEHFDFILAQIIGTSQGTGGPQDKISIDDYSCLSEMAKYAKDEDFKAQVNKFFWDMVIKADSDKNGSLIVTSLNFIRTNKIQIFRKQVAAAHHDHCCENQQQSAQEGQEQINTSSSPTKITQEQDVSHKVDDNFEKIIIESVIKNLTLYCSQVNEILSSSNDSAQILTESRKKMFFTNHKNSHHDQIDERLQFIKYVSTFSTTFKITKVELDQIYDLLVKNSKISSDQEEFLIWCKSLCESSSISNSILDLNQVGEFFTEKMKNKELDIKNLPLVGFEFLQHYFLSINEKASKLIKSQAKAKFVNKYNFYGYQYQQKSGKNSSDDEEKTPVFKLLTVPTNLDQLDIVWSVALQSENPKVVPKAVNFLIKVHYQLDEDLDDRKCQIQDDLIKKCMEILEQNQDEFTCNRVIEIIKHIIYEAEKKGTGDVQPHNAVLKGELLERLQIKYRSSAKKNSIVLSIYSNTTVWEFKKEVSKQFDLAPKYLKLERANGQVLKDLDNGKTLAEIGIQSYENLSAYKLHIEEEIANAPLLGIDGHLSDKARSIFEEWFKIYSDETGGMTRETCALFIKGCTGEHPPVNDDRITGLFNLYDVDKDGRIEQKEFMIFYETSARNKPDTVRENLRAHNVRPDLKKLSEVMEETSFKTADMPRYKISEQQDYFDKLMILLDRQDSVAQNTWDLIQMLATNRILYKRVLQLKTAMDPETGRIDWTKFFDSQSDYKLLYTLQIVEAVMEEGEGSNLERIVVIDDSPATIQVNKQAPPAPPLAGGDTVPAETGAAAVPLQKKLSEIVEDVTPVGGEPPKEEGGHQEQQVHMKKNLSLLIEEDENQKLKSEWTSMFLMNDGIQYIMKVFMDKQITNSSTSYANTFSSVFELKHIAFLLKLLRIFIMAAFSTSKESQVYQLATNVRRTSSCHEDHDHQKQESTVSATTQQQNSESEGSRFKELQTLLAGPLGEEIIQQIDYKLLQRNILRVIAQILAKKEMIFEDKLIIENALSLWVGCVIHRNELFSEFYQFKGGADDKISNCDDFILHGLLFCPYEKVRDEFRSALSTVSSKISSNSDIINPLKYLLELLSKNITLISNYHSRQYFDLFCTIIEDFFYKNQFNVKTDHFGFNPEQLLSHIIDKIKEYNHIAMELNAKENANDTNDDDSGNRSEQSELETVYIGLIQLTSKIIDNFEISLTAKIVEEKQLIEEIFVKFLFSAIFKDGGANQQKEIKIQPKKQRKSDKVQTFGKKSKEAAYKLINCLIKKSPLLMHNFMERSMIPLINSIRRLDVWNYSPVSQSNSSSSQQHDSKCQKFVGLRNLGCICYMNSMLQQFFMIPAFRYNLLCVDDHLPEDIKEYKGYRVDDNMLHQLQKLMAHLELSERSDYNPFEFCFAFKELDGNPTNTSEQKDAQEFLNLAFDRIENLLRSTSRKYLLQSVFGGQTCSQLVCQECGKVKNRIEDFYNLSLTVKDIKSMHESLQKLVEGEVINDYQCEGCGKKVDVSKRVLISQTPNVLIVHLQRILFNFDTFRNDKLNTFFEFPYQLDLKPYSFYEVMKKENRIKTKRGEDDDEDQEEVKQSKTEEKKEEENKDEDNQWPEEEDCFEYKLVGTTVHSGTANAGHYWSYINTRRGYLELNQDDPNWNKTENEPWMEYNDSRVSEFNFEKLRDECYGDQKTGGGGNSSYDESGFSSWGNYGKSAYMLVYERKKKKPIKIVVPEKEAKQQMEEQKTTQIVYDQKKDEYYKLIDYVEGVEDIAPNQIYKQVCEDNKKFEFDNDIYSQEFFDFIKSILQASLTLAQDGKKNMHPGQEGLLEQVNKNAIYVGKKTILEILAKCFYNQTIKNLVEILMDIMKTDDSLCYAFLNQCYEEDNFEYLLMIMLECPDAVARLNVALLMKFIITKLKMQEKDILYDMKKEEIPHVGNTEGSNPYVRIIETPVALSTRFILKCLENLNTLVAKNWSRFDYFLEVLYTFGVGDNEVNNSLGLSQEQIVQNEKIGMEFLFRQQFIGKACDFLLGRKSPMSTPNEKRYEMGGAYSNPNFGAVLKLLTKMINDSVLIAQYPLMDFEKRLLLQHDLLKVMLAQTSGSKQFGQCLANMCKDNLKFTKKVSKIFIKVINASTYDNVKNYLKALKPFLRLNDSLKTIRLEWVFGFQQVITRKEYRENLYKVGTEVISKINDEVFTYLSPIISSHSEEALLANLIKCKGRLDTFAINCLKEMLSLMAKDDIIAQFIYKTGPPTYQYARYIDWIKPYLESQKSELERNNSHMYMKSKYDQLIKSISLYNIFEQKIKVYDEEEKAAAEKLRQNDQIFQGSSTEWLAYQNDDVIKHYPPQYVLGRQIGDETVISVNEEHPLLTVTLIEQVNDYNYSNPTGFFNLSLSHIEFRTNMYQTLSYKQYKRATINNAANSKKVYKEEEEIEEDINKDGDPQTQNSEERKEESKEESKEEQKAPQEQEIPVRDWYENKKEGKVLLKVHVANRSQDTVKFRVSLRHGSDKQNLILPQSFMTDTLFANEWKCIGYFQKIDPSQPFTDIKFDVEAIKKSYGQAPKEGFSNQTHSGTGSDGLKINVYDADGSNRVSCIKCQTEQPASNIKCCKCSEVMMSGTTYEPQSQGETPEIYDNYYT